jgi:hypothetical protein
LEVKLALFLLQLCWAVAEHARLMTFVMTVQKVSWPVPTEMVQTCSSTYSGRRMSPNRGMLLLLTTTTVPLVVGSMEQRQEQQP